MSNAKLKKHETMSADKWNLPKKIKVESNSKRSYVMNATLSQNVVVIIFHEMPPTNNTERVQ